MNCYWCYQPVAMGESDYAHTHSGKELCDSGYNRAEVSSPTPRKSVYDHATGTFRLENTIEELMGIVGRRI